MALLTQFILPKPERAPAEPIDIILDLTTGTALGVGLNDIWEISGGPGYFQPFTTIPYGDKIISIGVDDVVQTFIGAMLMAWPVITQWTNHIGSTLTMLGAGIIVGTGLTKLGEIAGVPIQIIPHEVLPPAP